MNKQKRRGGFTLPEILVTVTVVAVLAAVVVPAVTQFATKGNAPATQQDIQGLRGGISGFVTDVRKYPLTLEQLTTPITISQTDITGAAYTALDVAAWKGPYFTSVVTAATGYTSAGLSLQVGDTLSHTLSWIVDPIKAPLSCVAVLGLDSALDKVDGALTGSVVWTDDATHPCTQANGSSGVLTNLLLRLTPAP
jgi:prepilin-type N-terminal cleavage/methylation domain-containing protein